MLLETHTKLLANDPRRSTLNSDAHSSQIKNAKSITHTTTTESTIKSQTKKIKNHCDKDRLALMLQPGFRRREREREREKCLEALKARMRRKKDKEMRKKIRRKESRPHEIKKNIIFTIGELCCLKFEIILFINTKNYDIYNT